MQRQPRNLLVLVMLLGTTPACVLEQDPGPEPGCEGGKCDQPAPSPGDGQTDYEQVVSDRTQSSLIPSDSERAEACKLECDGDYGQHGATGESFCLCRTPDAGTLCESNSECDGECLFDGFEATDESGEVGVAVGHCSEFQTEFGCTSRLPDWISERGPQPIPFEVPIICVH